MPIMSAARRVYVGSLVCIFPEQSMTLKSNCHLLFNPSNLDNLSQSALTDITKDSSWVTRGRDFKISLQLVVGDLDIDALEMRSLIEELARNLQNAEVLCLRAIQYPSDAGRYGTSWT